jgi:hypothetical protein
MSATAQDQKIISPLRPCFSIHKEYIHYEDIDVEIKALCRKYNWYLHHTNSYSYLDIYDDSQVEEDIINNGRAVDLGEEYKFDMDDDDDE